MSRLRLTLLVAICCIAAIAKGQRISVTLAGTGTAGYSGDNRPANTAMISRPYDACSDAAGNIYFSDGGNGRIRKVWARTGLITTVGGGGTLTSDGIAAITALLSPNYITCDAAGNLYICSGNRIRYIHAATGIITTVAGSINSGFTGDGGPATSALLYNPSGVCLDAANNLYIVDQYNNRIRKIDAATGLISTICGTDSAGYTGDGGPATLAKLNTPRDIAANSVGDIFFSDQNGRRIRKISVGGIITTIAGNAGGLGGDGGPATSAGIGNIYGVIADGNGDVVIDDESCSCRKINMTTGIITRIAGDLHGEGFNGDNKNSLLAYFNRPYGLCADAENNLYVAEYYGQRIRKSIAVTNAPKFAFGRGQSIYPCPGYTLSINKELAMVDVNTGQSETWSVVTPPANGTLSGFPYTATANGVDSVKTPAGMTYTSTAGYTGADSFRIRVTDGTYADTVTIYANVGMPLPGSISGASTLCTSISTTLSTTVSGGTWSVSNSHATISAAGALTGVSAGVDTVIYTISSPCNVISTAVVTINASPAIGPITGSDTVCAGYPATFTNSAPGGIWSINMSYAASIDSLSGVVNATITADPTISYTVSNALCTISATKAIRTQEIAAPISGSSTVCIGSIINLYQSIPGGTWSLSNANASIVSVSSGYVSIVGVATGADTLTYTNTTSCGTLSVRKIINVNPPTNAGIITGESSVCVGSNIFFSETVSGTWSVTNGNATINPYGGTLTGVSAGLDTVIYTVTGTCVATTARAVVSINPLPAAGVISGPDSICTGIPVTLTSTIPGGTWTRTGTTHANLTSATGVLTGISYGAQTVRYTVTAGGCNGWATKSIFIKSATAILTGAAVVCAGATVTLTTDLSGGTWSITNTNATLSVTGPASASVTGVSTGTDTIIYTITNSCGTVSVSKIISVDPPGNAGTINGQSSICTGVTNYYSSTVPGGAWALTNGNAVIVAGSFIKGVTPGIDTIVYTHNNGCHVATAYATITINPSPVAGTIVAPDTICIGSSITLSDTISGGTWTTAATTVASIDAVSGVLTGLASGTAVISFTVNNISCTTRATRAVTVGTLPGNINGTYNLCEGANVSFLNTSAPGGTWGSTSGHVSFYAISSTAGIGVHAESAGLDTITYTVINACGSTTIYRAITVNANPAPATISGPAALCAGASATYIASIPGGTWSLYNTNANIDDVTGMATGYFSGTDSVYYVVAGTGSAASCRTKTRLPVAINEAPFAGTISGPTAVCAGGPAILLSSSVTGGTWSMSNTHALISPTGMVSGVTSGIDTAYYNVTNSCGTAAAVAVINIHNAPDAGTITGLSSMCPSTSISLSVSATGGSWSVTNSAASVSGTGVLSGLASGTDTVLYTVTNTCGTDVAAHTITILPLPDAGIISGPTGVCQGSTMSLSSSSGGGNWSVYSSNASISASGVVTGILAGPDTIMYQVTNSCGTATATYPVEIQLYPVAGTITGSATVCEGASTTLSATGTGGTWTTGGTALTVNDTGIVTGMAGGTATVTYTVANSCGSALATFTVTVNPLPDEGVIYGTNTIYEGTTTLLGETVTDGTWLTGDASIATIAADGTVYGVAPGTCNIIYRTVNGCGESLAVFPFTVLSIGTINVNSVTGNMATLSVMPNPSKGSFTVSLTSEMTCNIQIQVINAVGMVVKEIPATTNKPTEINANLPSGIYMIKVNTANGAATCRIVIE